MDTEYRDQLKDVLGDGPLPRPVAAHVMAGRAALRRRRTGIAGAAAAAAVIASIGVTNVLDSVDSSSAPPIATQPTSATNPSAKPREEALTAAIPVDPGLAAACGRTECNPTRVSPVSFTADGTLVRVTDSLTVFQRADDPVAVPGGRSVALEASFQGSLRWWLVVQDSDGKVRAGAYNPSGRPIAFDEWTAVLTARTTGDPDGAKGPAGEIVRVRVLGKG